MLGSVEEMILLLILYLSYSYSKQNIHYLFDTLCIMFTVWQEVYNRETIPFICLHSLAKYESPLQWLVNDNKLRIERGIFEL